MGSIIPGYNYDIFISYRQKDNKGDKWVSNFVDVLKTELEATFKEEISVYFDINPHDGLLETHDVDESLKDKLKCLIFIPIISRTYCDPKSFAWEHEFKTFVELASQDQFGLKVKLPNGNVASRVLPVRIYDLDISDIKLCESVLGGVLRSVDFIYKSSGVNRPLHPKEDHPQDNLNKTYYRDQINKVANSIREVINTIGQNEQKPEEVSKDIYKSASVPKKSNKTKIIAVSTMALAVIILVFFFIPKLFKSEEPIEKSIAILPFINDSPDQENTYFINGLMEEVIINLQTIKNFRVLSRTSTDQFRGPERPTIPEIASKLGVNYLVEGSGQKYGNKFRLRVQLIKAKGKETHLWAKSYEQEIKETNDIFRIHVQIAEEIAAELKAVISLEEKQQIEKIPTPNLTAYDFYQRGQNELEKYDSSGERKALDLAEEFYKKALQYDSRFAQGYIGLASVFWRKHYTKTYFSRNFLDSVIILADRALKYNDQLAEAYLVKAAYYRENGNADKAINENNNAIKYNPNNWEAYWANGSLYSTFKNDYVKAIENYYKALSLNRGKGTADIYRSLGSLFSWGVGFRGEANYYFQEALNLDGDSAEYLISSAYLELWSRNYDKAIQLLNRSYTIDTTRSWIMGGLLLCHEFLRQDIESLEYSKKEAFRIDVQGDLNIEGSHRIGYAYWKNGFKEEAKKWFNKQIQICEETLKLGRGYSIDFSANYDLAGVYAFMGDKEKAYENLRAFNIGHICSLVWVTSINDDPMFDCIRNEPEFQQIVRDVEAKYQAEHERVRKWLEENNML